MGATQADTEGSYDVLIFYSSRTEPQLLDRYRDSISYLQDSDIETTVIDVVEEQERAREHDVIATPTVIVRDGNTEDRHLGIVNGLKDVLSNDIYGQSLLHRLGFKEGREFAREHDLHGADRKQVEDALHSHLTTQGMKDVQVTGLDLEDCTAEGLFTPDEDSKKGQAWHAKLEEFLGGVFTEVFGTGVMGAETKCVDDGYDHCAYTIGKTE